ncbi:MAG: metallophosphoesterase [Clostridia bacterium]|nr:metallophosphoesterase [Clostridia bacterium]
MKLLKNEIKIGLEKPLKILHVTDSHIALADEYDSELKHKLCEQKFSPEKEKYLHEHIAYAKKNCDILVHTGDMFDFVSHANTVKAREILSDDFIFFIAGNHEYSQYVGEAWEDKAYRMNSFMEIERYGGFGVPMLWNTRLIGGVNFVGIDNSYNLFEDWQLHHLKEEVKKGYPIILCFHAPLFEQSLYDYHYSRKTGDSCTYLTGLDEEHLKRYSEFRAYQQRPDEPTLRMIEYIKSEPMIKAILTGHLHFSYESNITEALPQFVTGGGYDDICREITII